MADEFFLKDSPDSSEEEEIGWTSLEVDRQSLVVTIQGDASSVCLGEPMGKSMSKHIIN